MEIGGSPRQVEPMEPAHKLLTVEEFLDTCPRDQRHYQLFDGVMVAMAPPATPHQVIAGSLSGEIYAARVRGEDLGFDIVAVVSDKASPGVSDQVDEINARYGWEIKKHFITKADYPEGEEPRGQTLAQAERLGQILDSYWFPPLCGLGLDEHFS